MNLRGLYISLTGFAMVSGVYPLSNSWAQSLGTQALDVCTKPSLPCNRPYKTFAPYELGLRLPKTIKLNVDYKSATVKRMQVVFNQIMQ
jgi:hypothetical protein